MTGVQKPNQRKLFAFIEEAEPQEEEKIKLNHEFTSILDAWWDLAAHIAEEELMRVARDKIRESDSVEDKTNV